MKRYIRRSVALAALLSAIFAATAAADSWPQKQHDPAKTGRAAFTVPAERLNGTFFNVLRWQKRSPNSPNEGNFDSSGMTFFDGVGPSGKDVVVAGYHWPKGVQGMDRHTGKLLWKGNPDGGESIGVITPAFSSNGQVIYVTNDATPHPLMAFRTAVGPSSYWHNGGDENPMNMGAYSPMVGPSGLVFLHTWSDRARGATDSGANLAETWTAAANTCSCYNQPSMYAGGGQPLVVIAGRCASVSGFDGMTGAEGMECVVGRRH